MFGLFAVAGHARRAGGRLDTMQDRAAWDGVCHVKPCNMAGWVKKKKNYYKPHFLVGSSFSLFLLIGSFWILLGTHF